MTATMTATTTPRTVTLLLDFPGRDLHPNGRPNRWDKARAISSYRRDARIIAKQAMGTAYRAGEYPLRVPVSADVTFIVTDDRRRDVDGLLSSIKAGFDGMVDAHLLLDDHAKVLLIGGLRVERGNKAWVRVVLTEAEV